MPRATLDDLLTADRVLCYGVTGSGKSTAAARLGEVLDLPAHFVDDEIGWLPGWVERPRAEQIALATELAAQERWILDSAYGSYRDHVLDRTQVVVALDYPRWFSFARLLRRTVMHVIDRTDICNGNVETWREVVSRDSILRWHVTSFAGKRERMRTWEGATDGPGVIRLTHPGQLDRLLDALAQAR